MSKIIVIALALGSVFSSSPVFARATNPSERPARFDQQADRAWVADPAKVLRPVLERIPAR